MIEYLVAGVCVATLVLLVVVYCALLKIRSLGDLVQHEKAIWRGLGQQWRDGK